MQDQEDRNDQRHRRKGVEHEQALEKGLAPAKGEAGDVVTGQRRDGENDRGLRQRKRKELKNAVHTEGNCPPAVAFERISSMMFGAPEKTIVGDVELPADECREQAPTARSSSSPATIRTRVEAAIRCTTL